MGRSTCLGDDLPALILTHSPLSLFWLYILFYLLPLPISARFPLLIGLILFCYAIRFGHRLDADSPPQILNLFSSHWHMSPPKQRAHFYSLGQWNFFDWQTSKGLAELRSARMNRRGRSDL